MVPVSELGFSLGVDLLHLVVNAAWVGGLLYIGIVLIPTLRKLGTTSRARVLAAPGPINATVHMTSWQQFLTTPYGWTLAVKIAFFLLMVAISAYHAFYLRPRLVRALASSTVVVENEPGQALVQVASASVSRIARAAPGTFETPSRLRGSQEDECNPEPIRSLADRLEGWLQREAALGIAVLLCVALLDVVFAGTLVPPIS